MLQVSAQDICLNWKHLVVLLQKLSPPNTPWTQKPQRYVIIFQAVPAGHTEHAYSTELLPSGWRTSKPCGNMGSTLHPGLAKSRERGVRTPGWVGELPGLERAGVSLGRRLTRSEMKPDHQDAVLVLAQCKNFIFSQSRRSLKSRFRRDRFQGLQSCCVGKDSCRHTPLSAAGPVPSRAPFKEPRCAGG